MPFRRDHIISAQSEVLPLSEESYLIDLKEAENNLLHFSLTGLPVLDESTEEATDIINSCKVPLLTRIYENLIGVRPIIPRPVITNDSLGDKPSAVPQISLLEVGQHDSFADCWIVIYDRVYDITDFLHSHPGGYDVIMEHAGRDATFAFRGSGHSPDAVKMLKKFEIGILPMEERLYRHETPIFRWGELPE